VAVFTNALTEAQIQDLFLRSIGLTSGVAPIITTQPASLVTLYQGQTLKLTVGAGGIPSPTYQWQWTTNNGTWWTNLANANASGTNSATLVFNNFPPAGWSARTNFHVIAMNSTAAPRAVQYRW